MGNNIMEDELEDVAKNAEKMLHITTNEAVADVDDKVKAFLCALTFLVNSKLKESVARSVIGSLGVKEEVISSLLESYGRVAAKYSVEMKKCQNLRRVHFKQVDWRFQATIASRSLLQQCQPKIVTKLTLGTKSFGEDDHEIALEMDVNMLQTLVATLEEALAEASSPLARKLIRNF